MRFIYWGEFSPVGYARQGTVPVPTFLSLRQGKPCRAKRSQSFHDGHLRPRWNRAACWNRLVAAALRRPRAAEGRIAKRGHGATEHRQFFGKKNLQYSGSRPPPGARGRSNEGP